MPKLNLSGVEEYDNLPRRNYHFRITDINTDDYETGETSKCPGTPMWRFEFTVESGEHKGRKVSSLVMIPITEEQRDTYEPRELVNILKAVDQWSDEEIVSEDFEFDVEDLIDAEFVGKVGPQKNNKEFDEIKRYYRYDEDLIEDPLDP